MALTNILREPRREITEIAVGAGTVCAFLVPIYLFGRWMEQFSNRDGEPCPLFLGMFAGFLVIVVVVVILFLVHAIGEAICNNLQRNGIDLRPR